MKFIEVKINEKQKYEKIGLAQSMIERLIGLMFIKEPESFDGLLIEPCNSIHTFFMRFSLDIVFLNKKNEVVKIIRNMKPWRMTLMYFRASKVLEVKAGTLHSDLKSGDQIEVECIS